MYPGFFLFRTTMIVVYGTKADAEEEANARHLSKDVLHDILLGAYKQTSAVNICKSMRTNRKTDKQTNGWTGEWKD